MTEETTIDWGAEIPVNKRPLWLIDDEQRVAFYDGADWYGLHKVFWSAEELDDEPNLKAIRLPVGHEYYSRPTTSEHPEYSPELVEKAFALLRTYNRPDDFGDDVRAILSELDKSKEVDPLVEAIADVLAEHVSPGEAHRVAERIAAITRKDEAA